MKKKITHAIMFANILLLTGCWGKKKKLPQPQNNIVLENEIKSNDDTENLCISFDNDENIYNIVESKSIFADDESGLNFEEQETTASVINPLDDSLVTTPIMNENNRMNGETIASVKKHIGTVQFAFNAYKEVKKDFQFELHQIASTINAMLEIKPELKVIIEGHACNSEGSERYNIELSHKRAMMMQDYIINQTQINPENISVFGCGTSHLIVYGDRTQQAPNRRAEIFVI